VMNSSQQLTNESVSCRQPGTVNVDSERSTQRLLDGETFGVCAVELADSYSEFLDREGFAAG
jgi:hypothetical protein